MNEETIEVVSGPGVFEVDASKIAAIIMLVCPVDETKATEAANVIVDYLIAALSNPQRPQ
jgi:hypothetical protein